MSPPTMKLYARHQNSAGQRVRIVLNLKGLAYDYVPVSSLGPERYRAINPQGLMPTLEIDGRFVAQSMAIIELLAERFPAPSIWPAEPLERAQARSFAGLICADLRPVNNNRIRRYLVDEIGADAAQVRRWYHHWVDVALTSLEAMLTARGKRDRYCFGNVPSAADARLVPQIDNARRFDCDLSAFPRLLAVDTACRELPALRAAAPENQPDFPRG